MAAVYLVSIAAESDDKVTQVDGAHLHHAAWVPTVVVYLVSIPAESDDKVTQVDGAHIH